MGNFVKTDDLLKDMCGIIESSREAAYKAVNVALVQSNWLFGYRIASEEMHGEEMKHQEVKANILLQILEKAMIIHI